MFVWALLWSIILIPSLLAPMNKHSSSGSEITFKQNQYLFSIDQQRTILISSQFQNGNISLVKQVNELHYILEALSDTNAAQSKKSWFHFKVKAEKAIKVRLVIQNVNIYENIFEDRAHCRPMMREGQNEWQQVSEAFLTYRDELSLVIDYTFKCYEQVYFCLSVPFTYSQNQQYLMNLSKFAHNKIHFEDQILALTPKQHKVHLLTVTEFGEDNSRERQDKKPVIFITARVHPGEVSSSFCLQGILQFLLSYNNLQAYLLRRMFIFKIVPMLNPDGVVEGNYRADPQGFNLNRFYLDPHKELHPAIYQLVQLIKRIGASQRIEYYFDLHSHSCIKQSFIYGNAFDDIVSQTYSELFCRILEQNFPRFRYSLSNFGQIHMKHKDKGQQLSKEGCGRVVISKLCAVVCSYTVQSSIFPSSYSKFIHKVHKNQPQNTDFNLSTIESEQAYYFEPLFVTCNLHENIIVAENKRLGKSLMISVLDMLAKNPYSRLRDNSAQNICKEMSNKLLQNQERFKLMDMKAYQKARNIIQFISDKFQQPLHKAWQSTNIAQELNRAEWPLSFKKIQAANDVKPQINNSKSNLKKLRMRTQGKSTELGGSLKKNNKQPEKMLQAQNSKLLETHRTITPKNHNQTKSLFPEIKYSIEMKINKNEAKSRSIKEMNIHFTEETQHNAKKLIVDYIQNEVSKLHTQKQLFKRTTNSLNRLIASKILEKEKTQIKGSCIRAYNMIGGYRARIKTEEKEGSENEKKDMQGEDKYRQQSGGGEEEGFKGFELKKADIIKKRLMLTNKAVQILKKSDRSRIKLPEVNKVTLIVENYKRAQASQMQECEETRFCGPQVD